MLHLLALSPCILKTCLVYPMASKSQQLHIILIPFLAQSHIIPILDFAKLLSQRDLIITIVSTPVNSSSIQSIIDHATISSHAKIKLVTVPFPSIQVGLPEGCENMDTLPSPDMATKLFAGCEMLQEPILKLLSNFQLRPSAIISSNALPWTGKVACSLGIPRYAFQTICCFSMLVSHNVGRMNVGQTVMSDSESFEVQNMPDKIVITKSQMPRRDSKKGGVDIRKVIQQMAEAERLTRGMVVNSFEDMEPKYVEALKNMGKKLWCIGPVSLCNQDMSDKLERGGKEGSIDGNVCLKWLDSMAPKSVIYACFGSIGRIPSAQIIETGLGLEASNRPFIWIIRKKDVSNQVEKWLDDEKFEERIKGRGLIIRGWAPQVVILSHPSVGGFITHCGWNSTLEAICAGVPMITWPMFAEQFYNEKLVVNVLKIGVRVGAEIAVKMELEDEDKVFVSSVQVKEAIEHLMDDEERIQRATELSQLAIKATNDGGSSFLNITALIQDITEQTNM